MKETGKQLILGGIGGLAYILVEFLWRGHSHWTMFVLGGLCFVYIGLINETYSWEMSLTFQAVYGAFIITVLEFIAGVILNICFGLGVWDYSGLPFNLLGQICLPYFLAWIPLAALAIIVDDILRYRFFHEEKPHYRIF